MATLTGNVAGLSQGKVISSELEAGGPIVHSGLGDFLGTHNEDTTGYEKPRSYLNWILLDEQFKYVPGNSGYLAVEGDNTAMTTLAQSGILIQKSGYLFVYVSNETIGWNVFFDNLVVQHYKGPLSQENSYYPGGMLMVGRKYSLSNYRYGFQKQENEDEIYSNAISFKYRIEDSRIVRFFSIDPLTGKYPFNSPYAFSQNRVIDGIELEGAEVLLIGKQESANIFIGGFGEIRVAIGPNGVYGYGTGGISLCTSTTVSTGIGVTFYPTMPTVQDARGWSWAGSGTGGEVGYLGGGPIYCSGYWGLTGVGGIGGSLGLLTEFGGLTLGASGSYTAFTPLSEFAKKNGAKYVFTEAKKKLTEMDGSLRKEINGLNTDTEELSTEIYNELSEKLNKPNTKENEASLKKIDENQKIINKNQEKVKMLSKRLETVDKGIKEIHAELNKK